MNTQNQRQIIQNPGDLNPIMRELNELVTLRNFPKSDYQFRKTYKITRNFPFPLSIIKYLGRRRI